MPSPVEALPCGSRSTTSTRCPAALSAVARLTAVVVLPTPPFWLAIAMIRARPMELAWLLVWTSRAVSSATRLLLLTALYPPQTQNDPARVGATVRARPLHRPVLLRPSHFLPRLLALCKEAHRPGCDKRLSQN